MSDIDRLEMDKGVIKGAETYIGPSQITATEISAGAIAAGDIANSAVNQSKIASAALGNGIAGGSGTVITLDVDDSTIAKDVGSDKCGIKPLGITAAKLAASTKGAGIVAGAGTAFALDVDGVTIHLNTNKVELVAASVSKAHLEATAKKHVVTIPLPAFVANNPVYAGLLACPTGKSYKITKCILSTVTVPNDADGTCLFRLVNYDVSDAADEVLVADFDCEGLVTLTGTDMAVISAPAGIDILGQTDYLYAVLTNNSVGIDQNWAGAICTIEYEEQ